MNYINAKVENIQSLDTLNLVNFSTNTQKIQMISLELNKKVQIGASVVLAVKATNISLAKDIHSVLSISNNLHVEIIDINFGELLCSVKLKLEDNILESIILKESALKMDLKIGENIIALIAENEISIMEVL